MLVLKNPYDGLWEKHLSIDDMDIILEMRTGGTYHGELPILSTNGKSVSTATVHSLSRSFNAVQ